MDTGNLGRGAMIAGISGALLLIFMFFTWYEVPAAESIEQVGQFLGSDVVEDATSVNGWEAFGFIDIICLLAIVTAVGLAFMTLMGGSASLPIAGSALTCGIGALAFILVLYRFFDPPEGLDREIGLYLGLITTAGIAVGGYLGMQEEGTSFAEQGERLRG